MEAQTALERDDDRFALSPRAWLEQYLLAAGFSAADAAAQASKVATICDGFAHSQTPALAR